MRLLVTGGLGFIGSNFILNMLKTYKDLSVTNLDLITYAGNLENLVDVKDYGNRYTFIKGSITDKSLVNEIVSAKPDAVVNFAAESHVDRSILDASEFLKTNIIGVQTLMDCCREHGVERFVQISTDEVYGSLGPTDPAFTETNVLKPNSPYSASKASADLLVRAYHKTYNMDVVITRCSNNYGPLQFPEKLIPLMITNAIQDLELPVYGDGLNVRDWIHVLDHCRAIDKVLRDGKSGGIYNIGGSCEYPNIDIVRLILAKLNKPLSLIKYVQDRPGHDRRYAMNATKIYDELGWAPSIDFEEGIDSTIKWYVNNESWWRKIKSGEYLDYYEKWYGNLKK